MPTQHADDPGLNLRGVWLGPSKNVRWPIDLTHAEWAYLAGLTIIWLGLLLFFVPFAAPILYLAWVGKKWVQGAMSTAHAWVLFACVVGITAVLVPNPTTWLLPMWWWLTPAIAPLISYLTIRKWGRHVNRQRPLAYWTAMPFRTANGPRINDTPEVDPALLASCIRHILDAEPKDPQ